MYEVPPALDRGGARLGGLGLWALWLGLPLAAGVAGQVLAEQVLNSKPAAALGSLVLAALAQGLLLWRRRVWLWAPLTIGVTSAAALLTSVKQLGLHDGDHVSDWF